MSTYMTESQARKAGLKGLKDSSKRRKYGNKPCEMDGFKFDSQAELKRYSELKLLERAGKIFGLKADKKLLRHPLAVNGIPIAIYECDFEYFDNVGDGYVFEDVKGVRTAAYLIKKKLMLAIYGIEIQEIG